MTPEEYLKAYGEFNDDGKLIGFNSPGQDIWDDHYIEFDPYGQDGRKVRRLKLDGDFSLDDLRAVIFFAERYWERKDER